MDQPRIGSIAHNVICDECLQDALRPLKVAAKPWVRTSSKGWLFVQTITAEHKCEYSQLVKLKELRGTCFRIEPASRGQYSGGPPYSLCPIHLVRLAQLVAAAGRRQQRETR